MADIYKLQYNGMTLAYPGWNGYVSWENAEVAYNLYLQQQIGGTITADKLSGMNGEIVTLGNTPDAGYQFNSYGITGAELSGNQFAFNGSDVSAQANFEEAVYTLTLQNDGHGTIAATKTTGHAGDTVTLSNTYNTYYRFKNYDVTGGTINGSTFTFGSQNATAKANFSANYFSAGGKFTTGTYSATKVGQKNYTAYQTAHNAAVPASWYSTSNQWNPSNASSYKIGITANMYATTGGNGLDSAYFAVRVNTTQYAYIKQTVYNGSNTNLSYPNTATYCRSYTYKPSVTSNVQGNVVQRLSGSNTNYGGLKFTANAGAWTATGYAP